MNVKSASTQINVLVILHVVIFNGMFRDIYKFNILYKLNKIHVIHLIFEKHLPLLLKLNMTPLKKEILFFVNPRYFLKSNQPHQYHVG